MVNDADECDFGEDRARAGTRQAARQQSELALDTSVVAPCEARRFVVDWLSGIGSSADVARDVALVVSELVTNAVVHAGSARRVVARAGDGRLRVEVHDGAVEPPVQRAPDAAFHGYGLQIVGAVAETWGWEPSPGGKYVWAELIDPD